MWVSVFYIFGGPKTLIFIIPVIVSTLVIANFIIKRTKSPTIRQVAMYYQFVLMSYIGLIAFVGGIALLVMIGKRL